MCSHWLATESGWCAAGGQGSGRSRQRIRTLWQGLWADWSGSHCWEHQIKAQWCRSVPARQLVSSCILLWPWLFWVGFHMDQVRGGTAGLGDGSFLEYHWEKKIRATASKLSQAGYWLCILLLYGRSARGSTAKAIWCISTWLCTCRRHNCQVVCQWARRFNAWLCFAGVRILFPLAKEAFPFRVTVAEGVHRRPSPVNRPHSTAHRGRIESWKYWNIECLVWLQRFLCFLASLLIMVNVSSCFLFPIAWIRFVSFILFCLFSFVLLCVSFCFCLILCFLASLFILVNVSSSLFGFRFPGSFLFLLFCFDFLLRCFVFDCLFVCFGFVVLFCFMFVYLFVCLVWFGLAWLAVCLFGLFVSRCAASLRHSAGSSSRLKSSHGGWD